MLVDKKNPKWKPSGWLNNIIAGKIEIRMKDDSDANIESLAKELIRRIKNEPSKPTIKQTLPPESRFETIRQKYLREDKIKRIVNEEKSFPIEQSYVNLALIETKEQQEKEKKLKQHDQEDMLERENEQDNHPKQHNDKILGSFEDIYEPKTTIDPKSIFDKYNNRTKKVLVLGRAGIGKSTFCQYVTYKWAKGEFWEQYKLIILIHLRKLTNNRYPPGKKYLPVDLVEKEYFPCDDDDLSKEERQFFKEQCNKGQVLWILDGYDEFAQNTPEQLNDVFDHVRDTQHHILTSRPYAIALPYDMKMEITGFTNDNIAEYVKRFFDQIKEEMKNAWSECQKLLNFLKSNASIWGVSHIPVNLELICSLWSDNDWSKKKSMTMTSLYDNLTEWLCRRYLVRQNINYEMTKQTVYRKCNTELQFLEQLAFKAMQSNKIILPIEILEETENEIGCSLDHPQLLNIGILKSYDDKPVGSRAQTKKQHYFVHLSFQEHFAARHLVKSLKGANKQKAIDFINKNKYNQRFLLLFIFASGLMAQSEYKECIDVFWSTIQGEPLDLIGLKHKKLIIECVNELAGQIVFRQCATLLKTICQWINLCFAEKEHKITENLFQSFERTNSLLNNSLIQAKFVELMESTDRDVKSTVFCYLSSLTISAPTEKFLSTMDNALEDENYTVRMCACETLVKMGKKAANEKVIDALINALQHQDSHDRRKACQALGKMDENAANEKVIDALINALQDKDYTVRMCACETLGKMDENAANEKVIDALINALQDKDYTVRMCACETLGKMDENAANEKVIDALINAFQHQDPHARWGACEVLRKMGEKVAREKVIDALINALQNEDHGVRYWACGVLWMMGEKEATERVIDTLINALQHQDPCVRWCACSVFELMGEKAATEKVIDALINALQNEDHGVRYCACAVLRKMGEIAANEKVIDAMINALQDEDSDVRCCAREVLGRMGEKEANEKVIDALINALQDEDRRVRWCACSVFELMGEKAATEKVIDALINALQDEDRRVRWCACSVFELMGEKAATEKVIDALINALQDEDSDVRCCAREVLGRMGEKEANEKVIDALINALQDEDYGVRYWACEVFWKMGEKAANEKVIDALIKALQNEDHGVRCCACAALRKMGEKESTEKVIDALINALQHQDDDVRWKAFTSLMMMAEEAASEKVIDDLINVLHDKNTRGRVGALAVLGEMGEKAANEKVIDALINALQNEDHGVRCCACAALRKMGEKESTEKVIDALINALQHQDPHVRREACQVLGEMGEKAASGKVIDALMNALQDEDRRVRSCAREVLGKMGIEAASEKVFDDLINAIQHQDSHVRREAYKVLGKLGEKAATKCVIVSLVNSLHGKVNDRMNEWMAAALNGAMLSFSAIKELDSNVIVKLYSCIRQLYFIEFTTMPSDQFVKVFLETGNDTWLPLVKYAARVQGIAITACDNKIIIYDKKDVVVIDTSKPELMKRFVNGLINDREELEIDSLAMHDVGETV